MGKYDQQANNLRKMRQEMNLRQEDLAKLLGYSVSGYRKLENGSRGLPISKALKATKILNCSLEEIFLPSNVPNRVSKDDE